MTSEQPLERYPSIEVPTTAGPMLRLISDVIQSCKTSLVWQSDHADEGISRSDSRWWSLYYPKSDISQLMQAGKGVRLVKRLERS